MAPTIVPFPSRDRFTLRRQTGTDATGRPVALVAFAIAGGCLVVGLRREPDGAWSEGLAELPAGMARMALDALLDATGFAPARHETALHLDLLRPEGTLLKQQVERLLFRHGRNAAPERGSSRPSGQRNGGAPVETTGLLALQSLGFHVIPEDSDLFALAAARSLRVPGTVAAGPPAEGVVRDFPIDVPLRQVTDFLEPWLAEARAMLMEGFVEGVPTEYWDGALCGHLAADGAVGTYRRQAAGLHPLFAPALANDPELSSLVDAGRPYEAALTALLARKVVLPSESAGLTTAKLRRLRNYPGDFHPHRLPQFLSILARLGLGRLPDDPAGWTSWVDNGALRLDAWARASRLDLPTLMPDTLAEEDLNQRSFLWLADMAERCGQTLVAPLLGIGLDGDPANHVAMRLLYGQGDVVAAKERCRRWHAALTPFENALPDADVGLSWPAVIEPYERFGIQVRALTTPAELRAEGASGVDNDGSDGLDHCVGGYAPRCHQGISHILSVRRRTPTGWERLSTAEITVREREGASPTEIIGLRQHQGPRNTPPTAEAVAALERVLDGIGDKRIPIDPEARMRRPASAYRHGVDWSDPAMIDASLRAWRPHLPRRFAHLDADGLRGVLRGLGTGILDQEACVAPAGGPDLASGTG